MTRSRSYLSWRRRDGGWGLGRDRDVSRRPRPSRRLSGAGRETGGGGEWGFREGFELFGLSSLWFPRGVKGGGSVTVSESGAEVFPHVVDVQHLPAVKR